MPSLAERDIVRRDADLPGLGTLLDPEAFRDALQLDANQRIQSARLRYLRYKPGQNCLAAYSLTMPGMEVECHAKAYRQCDITKMEKAESRATTESALGKGRFTWPHRGIEVCLFPNDNKLASLAMVMDDGRREDFLHRHLPEHPGLSRATTRTLAYKPGRRWVGALEVNGEPRAVCKLYGPSAFAAVCSKSKHFRPGEVLQLAPLIGRSKGRGALFFDWRNGRLLSEAMVEPSFDAAVLWRVGVALAELQRQRADALPVHSPAAQADALVNLGSFLEWLLPAHAAWIRAIAVRLASSIRNLPAKHAVVHGDFYAKQILFSAEAITVLDLDEASLGNAMDDLGSFLAHMERERALGRLPAQQHAACRTQFIAGYAAAAGAIDATQLPLFIAARLFARLPHYFRNADPEWPARTAETLMRVESLLGETGSTAPVPVAFDPKLPALKHALQLKPAEALLAEAIRKCDDSISQVILRSAEMRRYKPGRRALIEYVVELRRGENTEELVLLGKLRRRGVDVDNIAALRQLGADAFAADSLQEVSIPQSIGIVPDLAMTLQRRVPGQQVGDLLTSPSGPAVARRAADAICALHHCDLSLRHTHTIADELRILQTRLSSLAAAQPAWEDRLSELFRTCALLPGHLQDVPPRPIHRDFYHDQLLVDGNRVWLLDLDLLSAGDPALDAGNFVGHLVEWGIRKPGARRALEDAATVFTERFLELSGEDLREAVGIYTTLTLARHISISMQFPDRRPFTEQLLTLCEKRCGLANMPCHAALAAPTL